MNVSENARIKLVFQKLKHIFQSVSHWLSRDALHEQLLLSSEIFVHIEIEIRFSPVSGNCFWNGTAAEILPDNVREKKTYGPDG
jgi:hypothetical protein